MKAQIVLINPVRGMVAARLEDGSFAVFELSDFCTHEIGDIVSAKDFTEMGSIEIRNETQRENFSAYMQNHVSTMDAARRRTFL